MNRPWNRLALERDVSMATISSELVRKPLVVPPQRELPGNVPAEWAAVLGYKGLEETGEDKLHRLVDEAFRSMAFAPLCPDAVARYRATKVPGLPHFFATGLTVVAFFVVTISLFAGLVWCVTSLLFMENQGFGKLVAWGLFAGGVLTGMSLMAWKVLAPSPSINAEWRSFNLKGYEKPVPRWALQTAIETKAALESRGVACEFFVVELVESEDCDPFLLVHARVGDCVESHYLEVWEEPGFDAPRQI